MYIVEADLILMFVWSFRGDFCSNGHAKVRKWFSNTYFMFTINISFRVAFVKVIFIFKIYRHFMNFLSASKMLK